MQFQFLHFILCVFTGVMNFPMLPFHPLSFICKYRECQFPKRAKQLVFIINDEYYNEGKIPSRRWHKMNRIFSYGPQQERDEQKTNDEILKHVYLVRCGFLHWNKFLFEKFMYFYGQFIIMNNTIPIETISNIIFTSKLNLSFTVYHGFFMISNGYNSLLHIYM